MSYMYGIKINVYQNIYFTHQLEPRQKKYHFQIKMQLVLPYTHIHKKLHMCQTNRTIWHLITFAFIMKMKVRRESKQLPHLRIKKRFRFSIEQDREPMVLNLDHPVIYDRRLRNTLISSFNLPAVVPGYLI